MSGGHSLCIRIWLRPKTCGSQLKSYMQPWWSFCWSIRDAMVALTVPSLLWRLFSVRAPKVPFLDDPSLDVSIQINMVRFVFKYTIFWPMTNSMLYIYSFTNLFSSTAQVLIAMVLMLIWSSNVPTLSEAAVMGLAYVVCPGMSRIYIYIYLYVQKRSYNTCVHIQLIYIYNLSNFLYRQAGLCFKKSVTICCDCRSCLHSTLKEK